MLVGLLPSASLTRAALAPEPGRRAERGGEPARPSVFSMTSLVTCASARGMMRANKLVRSLCSTAPPRRNAFKQALKQAAAAQSLPELQAAGFPLLGLWASAGSPQVTELVALTPGLSWLVIDMEHAPNTLPSVLAQLHASQAASAEPI